MKRRPDWLKRPPWRTVVPLGLLVGIGCLAYLLWTPGRDIRDGRHDRGTNGVWMQHGWLGDDGWFQRNNKTERIPEFREPTALKTTAERLRTHHITDVFPHLCPAQPDGSIAAVDDKQVERFLDVFAPPFRVLPWVGGVFGEQIHPEDAKWRGRFVASVRRLLTNHPRLAGVQLNVEPWPSGNPEMLTLLDELKRSLPPGKILAVSAYPPPTLFHPHPEVHWEEPYFREVARRCDHLAVMLYDTALRHPKLYQNLTAEWTVQVLNWSEGKPVLLGLPAYEDEGVGYHDPATENLANALPGIHAGLSRFPVPPAHYQGTALYSEWVTDESEWHSYRVRFLKP